MERDWIGNFFAKTEQNLKFLVLIMMVVEY